MVKHVNPIPRQRKNLDHLLRPLLSPGPALNQTANHNRSQRPLKETIPNKLTVAQTKVALNLTVPIILPRKPPALRKTTTINLWCCNLPIEVGISTTIAA
jgi:hypothetical protein